MGDGEDAEVGARTEHLAHACRDDAQRIDVEARVGLVEDGEVGLEDRHLEDLVALLLTAGESLVEVAVGEGRIHVEPFHPLHDREAQLEHRQVDAAAGRPRLAQEVEDGHALDLLRVLEREEHAGLGPHVGGPVGDVVALEQDAAARHDVVGAAEEGGRERGLARAVGAHEGMDLAGADPQVDAPQDLDPVVAGGGDVEVLDGEQGGGHGPESTSPAEFALPP